MTWTQPLDLKLEYGIVDGEGVIIDEISAGSLRRSPYKTMQPNLDKPDILDELDPEGKLGKDPYRLGD